MKTESPLWGECANCNAPQERPLPEGWSYTTRKRYGLLFVTPHLADCPDGFTKVELPDDEC